MKTKKPVLSRRDRFALAALQAIIRKTPVVTSPLTDAARFERVANGAVAYADALIERLRAPKQ